MLSRLREGRDMALSAPDPKALSSSMQNCYSSSGQTEERPTDPDLLRRLAVLDEADTEQRDLATIDFSELSGKLEHGRVAPVAVDPCQHSPIGDGGYSAAFLHSPHQPPNSGGMGFEIRLPGRQDLDRSLPIPARPSQVTKLAVGGSARPLIGSSDFHALDQPTR